MASEEQLKELQPLGKYLSFLPELERTLISLYFETNMSQADIADIMGITQGAVAHRLKKAKRRLAYLRDLDIVKEEGRSEIDQMCDPFEREMIRTLAETTSQSQTAIHMNKVFALEEGRRMTQGKVRHKMIRIKQRAKYLSFHRAEVYLTFIIENLYLRQEIFNSNSAGQWL